MIVGIRIVQLEVRDADDGVTREDFQRIPRLDFANAVEIAFKLLRAKLVRLLRVHARSFRCRGSLCHGRATFRIFHARAT